MSQDKPPGSAAAAEGHGPERPLDICVLHDPVPHDAPPDQQDTLIQAAAVARALERLGHAPRLLAFGPDLDAARQGLEARPPALAVNLVESLAGLEALACAAPALLSALGIAFTGSAASALLATASKSAVKRRLRQAGLPTPDWFERSPSRGGPAFAPGLYILKPDQSHGSVGIDASCVVRAESRDELSTLLARRAQALRQPCLAEAFVPGREFSVALLAGQNGFNGPEALPPAEMRFPDAWPEETRVLCYASKWQEQSAAFAGTVRAFPENEPELLARLADIALAVWRVFGLSGYARVDFRLDARREAGGAPQIIDVNANPCLAPDAGFAAAAARAGLGYDALTGRIIAAALEPPGAQAHLARAAGDVRWRTHVLPGDAEAVRRLVESTGFFNAEEIVVAGDLVQEHLAKGDASGYFYVLAEEGAPAHTDPGAAARLAGYACYGPVPGTADSFDLYWIAVAPEHQGQGLGGGLLARAEADMAARGARGIYVETSSRGQYLPTRRFYEKHGYAACARLAGFYAAGDDKIIYHKRAQAAQTERT